jgi:hypothetical protein
MLQERIQHWILWIIRNIQIVILQEGDNKYKEGPFEDRGVAGETGDWIDIGALDLGSEGGSIEPENTI